MVEEMFTADEAGSVLARAWRVYISSWTHVIHVSGVDVIIFNLYGTQAELRGRCD